MHLAAESAPRKAEKFWFRMMKCHATEKFCRDPGLDLELTSDEVLEYYKGRVGVVIKERGGDVDQELHEQFEARAKAGKK